MCSTTMMDLTNTTKDVQAVGSSLATALRDRQAYVIPIQPNRSLPVRPAPHHTPCRTSIVRSSFARPPSFAITSLEPPVVEAPQSSSTVIEETSTATKEPEINLQEEKQSSEAKKSKEENEAFSEKNTEENSRDMRRNYNCDIRDFLTTNENRLIDISHSPEPIELDVGSDEVTIYSSTNEATSPVCRSDESSLRDKKKRRRKGIKRTMEEAREDFLMSFADEKRFGRTVPPLRLKKIQTLQEPLPSGGPSWQGRGREIDDTTFAINTGSMCNMKRLENDDNSADVEAIKEYSSKYRIVTGHTPPYEDCIDSSPIKEYQMDSLDAAKVRYRESKLKLKLRELRKKTLELSKQMLRTVLTTSAPRGSRLRQTMHRYEKQIENLEKLLKALPKATVYIDEVEDIDWHDSADTTNDIMEQGIEGNLVISPARARSDSTSSSLRSSPSLEPPKLSPKSPTNYAAARSPSEVRNSPPVLPRVYVTIADCREYSWDGRNNLSRRGRVKKRIRSPGKEDQISELPVSSTTTENVVKDKIELIDVVENKKSTNENIIKVRKTDSDLASCKSVNILEVYESDRSTKETKDLIDKTEDVKPIVKLSSSPEPEEIDTTGVDADFNAKPEFIEEIGELLVDDCTEVGSPPISSTCEIARVNDGENKGVVTVGDETLEEQHTGNGFTIDEQFPTLGNWLAKLSKKKASIAESDTKLLDAVPVEDRSNAFQEVFNVDIDKPTTPEVLQSSASSMTHENMVTSQWRNERWQEQQDQQPPLTQSYAPALPLHPPPPPPQLGQEFCSPIAMTRLYARNYAIDPYSVAYGYNPAIAAAAATASLWNGAAILQYPLMRPNSALLASHASRLQSSNVQFPTGTVTQRPAYRGTQLSTEAKRSTIDASINYYGQRDAKLSASGVSNHHEQTQRANSKFQQSLAAEQSRISCNNGNGQTMNYRTCLQQQQALQQQQPQQQQQFARSYYSDSMMRLPVPGTTWRSGQVIGTMGTGYNYSGQSSWPATSGNMLNSLSRPSTLGLATSSSVLSINSSRMRPIKESHDSNLRNCETPHLGKVAYSPNTVNNLACSNCGLAGSMFKCLGCEVAFYCDENCQARHWNRHVISCPKKMPKLRKVIH